MTTLAIKKFRAIIMMFVFFACSIRMGEAQVPGPVLGNMNPTGLAGKSAELATLAPGVFAVQETHLTPIGISRFKQEL